MGSWLWIAPLVVVLAILAMAIIIVAEAIRRSYCTHQRQVTNMDGDRVCLACRANLGKVDAG